jgi:DNA mismatch endonuclease, patch repair protein
MMAGIKGRDTRPELLVRRGLHARGLRYRLGGRGLPGRPDLVFPGRRAVVFVHGCFWHRHKDCRYASTPASRKQFWTEKFQANVARDAAVQEQLRSAGWRVFVIWECELRKGEVREALLDGLALELRQEGRAP